MKQRSILPVEPYRALIVAIVMLVLAVAASTALQAQTYSVLYNFSPGTKSGDPSNPAGQIAQGRDGNLWSTTFTGGSFFNGAAFDVTPAGTMSKIFDFNTPGGTAPYSGLTLGTDGNFYGTTEAGGTFGMGTLFKMTSTGTITTLYNFGTCTYPCKEGAFPKTPPVEGTDGNFYGTTGNSNDGINDGVVYKLTSAGKFSTIYAFPFGGTAGYNPQAPLIQGADGNLYGTTSSGGITVSPTCWGSTSSCGTVFKITTGGKLTTIYKFDQTHGAGPLSPVIQGTDGNFYGTTSAGGTSGLGVVFKLTSAGVITVLHNFIGSDGEKPLAGLVQANDGNFYGVASAGGSLGFGTIFKMTSTSDHTFSVIYDFDQTHGQAPEAALFQNTNGILYGNTADGGSDGAGVFYSLNISAAQFAKPQTNGGRVGSTVSILGQGFIGSTAVSFGGVNATTFTVVSDNYVTARVPPGGKTGTVTVVRPSGSLSSVQQFKITPTISSISPTSGPIGTAVVIAGTGLLQTTKVTIGGVKVTAFTVNSDSSVSATVPSACKTGKIIVTTSGGSASSSTTFNVTPTITSFTPTSGKVGTSVVITGSGLTQTTSVTFGGVTATTFTVNSDTQVTATVPTGAITGKIAITTTGGTTTSSGTFTVTP
jgi:uncharacterized repeat protein (TIGR03803 family)